MATKKSNPPVASNSESDPIKAFAQTVASPASLLPVAPPANTLTYEQIVANAEAFGSNSAAGADSMLDLGRLVYDGTLQGVLTRDQIRTVFTRFATRSNESKTGSKLALSNANSVNSAVTKLTRFAKLAAFPPMQGDREAFDVVTRALVVLAKGDDGKKIAGSRYEHIGTLLIAAVAQGSLVGFTDEKLLGLYTKKPAAVKDASDTLLALATAAENAMAKFPGAGAFFERVRREAIAQEAAMRKAVAEQARGEQAVRLIAAE